MQEFEEALEGHALLKIGPSGVEKCELIFTLILSNTSQQGFTTYLRLQQTFIQVGLPKKVKKKLTAKK